MTGDYNFNAKLAKLLAGSWGGGNPLDPTLPPVGIQSGLVAEAAEVAGVIDALYGSLSSIISVLGRFVSIHFLVLIIEVGISFLRDSN